MKSSNTRMVSCNISPVSHKAKPITMQDSTQLRKNPYPNIDIDAVIENALNGQSFSVAYLVNDEPVNIYSGISDKHWVSQDMFIVDIDNAKNEDKLTPNGAVDILKASGLGYYAMYYTFSHKESHPK